MHADVLDEVERMSLSEIDLIQSICRENFYEFVKEFIPLLIPEEIVWNWHIQFLCDELQESAELVFKRLPKKHDTTINVPPSTLKSTICSILFPPWIWTRMPEARIISASYEHVLALNFARKSRDIIESEKYQQTFRFKKRKVRLPSGTVIERFLPSMDPDALPIKLKDDTNSKGMYENMAHGDRKSVGTKGQIFGSHSHFIIVDDPMNPKETVSEPALAAVNRFMDEVLPSRTVDKKVTPQLLIMQRLHQDDPTGHQLAKAKPGEVRHICLPARNEKGSLILPAVLVRKYDRQDGFLDPVRLGQETLDSQLRKLGRFGYAGQYAQNPVPLGGGMFDVSQVKRGRRPHLDDFIEIARYWDKAGTHKAGARSAGVKLALDRWDRVWILDSRKGQWSVTERNMVMEQTAQSDGEGVIVGLEQEPGSGGKESAENSIKREFAGYHVIKDKVTGDKVYRAEPLAGQMGIGNVYVPDDAPWWEDMKSEFQFFPVGTFKDQVDAAAGAYAMLNRRKRTGSLFDHDERGIA